MHEVLNIDEKITGELIRYLEKSGNKKEEFIEIKKRMKGLIGKLMLMELELYFPKLLRIGKK